MSRRGKKWRYAADIRRELELLDLQETARAAAWVQERVARMPHHWGKLIAAEHGKRGGAADAAANRWLMDATEQAGGLVRLSASDDDIRTAAKVASGEAKSRAMVLQGGAGDVLESLRHTCSRWGVSPAEPKKREGQIDIMPAVARMICGRWWLRKLRVAAGQRCERAAIGAGLVKRGRWVYASQDTVERRRQQRRRQQDAIDGAMLEDMDSGEQVALADAVAGSVSNPEIKRGELMTRVKGCDEFAAGKGWLCEFWTLTTPSRFHAQTTAGGGVSANPVFDGSTPKQAQAYLCKTWARARAAWQRQKLQVVGLRTAEPHHDATPHWHLIVYGEAAALEQARDILRKHALADSTNEPGAEKRRFVWLRAAGMDGAAYAAKYVAKNIDGRSMEAADSDETGGKVSDALLRVEAWARTWRVRQFQFFGVPMVGIWRALRKIRQECAPAEEAIEQARAAADRGAWAAFWRAIDGREVKLLREAGERLTVYGDEAARRVIGVVEGANSALLDLRAWVVKWGALRAAARAAGGRGSLVPCL